MMRTLHWILTNLVEISFVLGISALILSLFFGGCVDEVRKSRPDCLVSHEGDTLVFRSNPYMEAPRNVYVCPFKGVDDAKGCVDTARVLGCKKPEGGSLIKP